MSTGQAVCANCGKTYGEHLLHDGNKCALGSVARWFPKKLADAMNSEPSLNTVCPGCGLTYSLHTHTGCPDVAVLRLARAGAKRVRAKEGAQT